MLKPAILLLAGTLGLAAPACASDAQSRSWISSLDQTTKRFEKSVNDQLRRRGRSMAVKLRDVPQDQRDALAFDRPGVEALIGFFATYGRLDSEK